MSGFDLAGDALQQDGLVQLKRRAALRVAFDKEELALAAQRHFYVCGFNLGIFGTVLFIRYLLSPVDFWASASTRLPFGLFWFPTLC